MKARECDSHLVNNSLRNDNICILTYLPMVLFDNGPASVSELCQTGQDICVNNYDFQNDWIYQYYYLLTKICIVFNPFYWPKCASFFNRLYLVDNPYIPYIPDNKKCSPSVVNPDCHFPDVFLQYSDFFNKKKYCPTTPIRHKHNVKVILVIHDKQCYIVPLDSFVQHYFTIYDISLFYS